MRTMLGKSYCMKWLRQSERCLFMVLLSLLSSFFWVGVSCAQTFNLTISANQSNVNLRSYALANGWNGTDVLIVTIASGAYVYSSGAFLTPALTIDGAFPIGSKLINFGTIVGRGGFGGTGGFIKVEDSVWTRYIVTAGTGGIGGPGLRVRVPFTIANHGLIGGGGGGGGGGASSHLVFGRDGFAIGYTCYSGGGGGGIGNGAGSITYSDYPPTNSGLANLGSAATLSAFGNRGNACPNSSNVGGNGGGYGQSGQNGVGVNSLGAPGQGGTGGSYIQTNTSLFTINWQATGQRLVNATNDLTLSTFFSVTSVFPSIASAGIVVSGTYRCTNSGTAFASNVDCTSSATGATLGSKSCDVFDMTNILIASNIGMPYAGGLSPSQYIVCSTSYTQPDSNTSVVFTINATSPQGNRSANFTINTLYPDLRISNAPTGGFPGSASAGTVVSGKYRCTNLEQADAKGVRCNLSSPTAGVTITPLGCTLNGTGAVVMTPPASYAVLSQNQFLECEASYVQPITNTNVSLAASTSNTVYESITNNNNLNLTVNTLYPDLRISNAPTGGFPGSASAGTVVSGKYRCTNLEQVDTKGVRCGLSSPTAGVTITPLGCTLNGTGAVVMTPPASYAVLSQNQFLECEASYVQPITNTNVSLAASTSSTVYESIANNNNLNLTVNTLYPDLQISNAPTGGFPSYAANGSLISAKYRCVNVGLADALSVACNITSSVSLTQSGCTLNGTGAVVLIPPAQYTKLEANQYLECTVSYTQPGGNVSFSLSTTNTINEAMSNNSATINVRAGTRPASPPLTFTTCGAAGLNGPTQTDCNATYGAGVVTINTRGIQEWRVPFTALFRIEVTGARGGNQGGLGANMTGDFSLTEGQVLGILVGQQGGVGLTTCNAGGGGGSFVWDTATTTNPLIVAGGGGGKRPNAAVTGADAKIGVDGGQSSININSSPGSNGNGASPGGAGWNTNGGVGLLNGSLAANNGNLRPLAGGTGGAKNSTDVGDGGFGGGAAASGHPCTNGGSGGGGGYSGGAGPATTTESAVGGGGGSYNSGTNQINVAGVGTGDGLIVITPLLKTTVTASNAMTQSFPSSASAGMLVNGRYRCANIGTYDTNVLDCAANVIGATVVTKACGLYGGNGSLLVNNISIPYALIFSPEQYIECDMSYIQPISNTDVEITVTASSPDTFGTVSSSFAITTLYPDIQASVAVVGGFPSNASAGAPVSGKYQCTNLSVANASGVFCNLSSPTAGITILPLGCKLNGVGSVVVTPPASYALLSQNEYLECSASYTQPTSNTNVVLVVNGSAAGHESITGNNSASMTVTTLYPDIQASVAVVGGFPGNASAGAPVSGKYQCINLGVGNATNVTCNLSSPTAGITILPLGCKLNGGGSVVVTPPASYALLSQNEYLECTASYTQPTSNTNVVLVVNGSAAGHESITGNNSASVTVGTIYPDLQASMAVPGGFSGVARAGSNIFGKYRCFNVGVINANGVTCGLTSPTPGITIVPLGCTFNGGDDVVMTPPASYAVLSPGEYLECNAAYRQPTTNTNVVLTINTNISGYEAITTNNSASIVMNNSFPDLEASLEVPGGFPINAGAGLTVSGTYRCTNLGESNATNVNCGLSSSTAGVVITPLGCTVNGAGSSVAMPYTSLGQNQYLECSASYVQPANTTVMLFASTSSDVNETLITNNSASLAVSSIYLDLETSLVGSGFPANASAGVIVSSTYQCMNIGAASALAVNCEVITTTPGVSIISEGCRFNGTGASVAMPYTSLATNDYLECTSSYVQPITNTNVDLRVSTISSLYEALTSNNDIILTVNTLYPDLQASVAVVGGFSGSASAASTVSGKYRCTNLGVANALDVRCDLSSPTAGVVITPLGCTLNGSGSLVLMPPASYASLATNEFLECYASYVQPANIAASLVASTSGVVYETVMTNNSSSMSVAPILISDIKIGPMVLIGNASAGTIQSGTVVISNLGPSTATNVNGELSWNLPGSAPVLTNCSPIASLASGAQVVCNFSYTVPASGSVNINASGGSPNFDPDTGNNGPGGGTDTTVIPIANIRVGPIRLIGNASAGQVQHGTLEITNLGPSTAENVNANLTWNLPGSAAPALGSCTPGGNLPIASLSSGASVLCPFSYLVPSEGSVSFDAQASSSTPGGSIDNVGSGASTTVILVSDAFVNSAHNQSLSNKVVDAGSVMNEQIRCSNAGPSVARVSSCVLDWSGSPTAPMATFPVSQCVLMPSSVATTLPASVAIGGYVECRASYRVMAGGSVSAVIKTINSINDASAANDVQSYTPTLRLVADVRPIELSLPDSIVSGNTYTGTVTCVNLGPSTASNVSCGLTGTPVPNARITGCGVGSSGGVVASLASGATMTCTVEYVAPGSGPIDWRVTVNASNTNGVLDIIDPDTDNTSSRSPSGSYNPILQEVSRMNVSISGLSSVANAGDLVSGVATCLNEGPSVARNANCVVSFNPSSLADKNVVCRKNSVGTPLSVVNLSVNESIVCSIQYRVPSSGSVVVSLLSSSATPDGVGPPLLQTGPGGSTGNSVSFTMTAVSPKIDVVESLGTIKQMGRFKFEIPYVVKVGNVGVAMVYKAQVDNNLASTFSANNPLITIKPGSMNVSSSGASCVINNGFNGNNNTRLLNGQSDLNTGSWCEIRFIAEVDYTNAGVIPSSVQQSRSFASGLAYNELINNGSSSNEVFETTDYATYVSTVVDGNGMPGSPNLPSVPQGDVPSTLSVVSIGSAVAKVEVLLGVGTPLQSEYQFNTSTQEQTYTFDVPMKVLVGAASGAGISYGVQVNMPLLYTFSDASLQGITTSTRVKAGSMSVQALHGAQCTLNNGFNGGSDTRLLSGTDTIGAQQGCLISYVGQVIHQGKTSVDQPHVYPLNATVFSVRAYGSSLNLGAVNPGHSFGYNSSTRVITGTVPVGYTSEDKSTSAGSAQAGAAGELATAPNPNLPDAPGEDDPGAAVDIHLALQDQTVDGVAYIDKNGNRVLDEKLGEAIEGILVDIVDARGKTPLRSMVNDYTVSNLNALSLNNGRYTIIGVPPGMWTFRFRRGSGGTILATVNNVPVILNNASVANAIDSLPQGSPVYDAIREQLNALGASLVPSGFVYDSITKERYGNVRLYLQYCGSVLTESSCVNAGPTILPSQETGGVLTVNTETADKGSYGFNLLPTAPAGVYRIEIDKNTLPAGMSYPSAVWSPEVDLNGNSVDLVPVIREVDNQGVYYASTQLYPSQDAEGATRYYRTFRLESAGLMSKMVTNHIPIDRSEALQTALFIRKEVDRKRVEIGGTLLYRVTLRATPYAFNPAKLIDTLPLGFKMIPGTARRMDSNGKMQEIPDRDIEGDVGPVLTFKNLYLKHNQDYVIEYRVRVNVGADRGTGTNSAYGVMGAGSVKRISDTAKVKVKVDMGVFTKEGCVLGKVYMDCSGNNEQDEGELGVPGVVLVMQDGMSITTDVNGQYSLCGLKPMTNVIRVDEWSLPEGAQLGLVDSRNTGNPSSRFVDIKDGELSRADFRVLRCSNRAIENVQERISKQEEKSPNAIPVKGDVRKGEDGLGVGGGKREFKSDGSQVEKWMECESGEERVECSNLPEHEKEMIPD